MINKKFHKNLLLGLAAATMSLSVLGCGLNLNDLISAAQIKTTGQTTKKISASLEVQASPAQTQKASAQSKQIEELKTTNPELATQLEALKDLSAEERKTKMDELLAKYPEELKNFAPPQGQGNGMEKGLGGDVAKFIEELKKNNADLAAQLEALKDVSPEERKNKIDALVAQYPEELKNLPKPQGQGGDVAKFIEELKKTNAALAAQLEALKDVTPEERKTKIDALVAQYPEELKNLPKPQGQEGQGVDISKQIEELKTTNPEVATQLEALKDLSAEERKTKMDELLAKYPDVLKKFAPPQGQGNGQMNGQGNGQMNGQGNGQMNGQGNGQMNGQGNGQMNGQGNGQMNGQGNGQMNGQGNGQMNGQGPGAGQAHSAQNNNNAR